MAMGRSELERERERERERFLGLFLERFLSPKVDHTLTLAVQSVMAGSKSRGEFHNADSCQDCFAVGLLAR